MRYFFVFSFLGLFTSFASAEVVPIPTKSCQKTILSNASNLKSIATGLAQGYEESRKTSLDLVTAEGVQLRIDIDQMGRGIDVILDSAGPGLAMKDARANKILAQICMLSDFKTEPVFNQLAHTDGPGETKLNSKCSAFIRQLSRKDSDAAQAIWDAWFTSYTTNATPFDPYDAQVAAWNKAFVDGRQRVAVNQPVTPLQKAVLENRCANNGKLSITDNRTDEEKRRHAK